MIEAELGAPQTHEDGVVVAQAFGLLHMNVSLVERRRSRRIRAVRMSSPLCLGYGCDELRDGLTWFDKTASTEK